MKDQGITGDFIDDILEEIKLDIDKLYESAYSDRWMVLYHLGERVSMLENYLHIIESTNTLPKQNKFEEQLEQDVMLKQAGILGQDVMLKQAGILGQDEMPEQAGVLVQEEMQTPENNTPITFTEEELAEFDGRNGKNAYVAINNTIYDVTNIGVWAAASHFGLHAGKNLTNDYMTCHAGTNSLSKLPIVGKLK